jgi:hypothetical protein
VTEDDGLFHAPINLLKAREPRANHTLQCAMKLIDGMGGNPHGLYQGAHEPLGLSVA